MNTAWNNPKFTLPLAALSLLAASTITHAQDDWVRHSPVPYTDSEMLNFESIAFFTPDHGFISGSQNFLLETIDGGETWNRFDFPASPVPSDLSKLYFFDDMHGWVIGSGDGGGISGNYRTTDGGQTWQSMNDLIGTFRRIEFLTPTFGWIRGNGSAAVTVDGGQNWNNFYLNPPLWTDNIAEADFANEQLGLGVHHDNTEVYRTTNGGQTWDVVATGGDLRKPMFLSESVALIPNLLGQLQRSTDGGQTFNDVNGPAFGFTDLLVFTDQIAIAYNTSGVIRTVDGGLNWQPIDLPIAAYIWDIQQLDDTKAMIQLQHALPAVPWEGIITTDSGATWNSAYASAVRNADYVLSDQMTGYSVGLYGLMLKTTDGGSSWVYHSNGLSKNLRDIEMIDEHSGVAVGYMILYTEDGEKWIPSEIHGSGSILRKVTHFGDTFYAVGEDALYQKSTDGGRTWTTDHLFGGFWDNLWDIQFVSENEGWSVASPARIIHTTDGGENWDLQFSSNGFGLFCLYFIDSQRGWVAGPSDGIFRTIDGGVSWTVHDIPDPPGANDAKTDIYFIDENLGYLVGHHGYVAKTLNGGLSWFNVDLPVCCDISELRVLSADELIVSCSFPEAIYHSQNGGQTWQLILTGFEDEDIFVSYRGMAQTPSGRLYVAGDRGHIFAQSAPQNPGDLNGDGEVGPGDLAILLGSWGACPQKGACSADLNGDGEVGPPDLAMLLGNWG